MLLFFAFLILSAILLYITYQSGYKRGRRTLSRQYESTAIAARELAVQEWLSEFIVEPDPLAHAIRYLEVVQISPSDVVKGPYVVSELIDRAAKNGLQPIGRLGDSVAFDPALYYADSPCAVNETVQILRIGWQFKSTVLRPAIVRRIKSL